MGRAFEFRKERKFKRWSKMAIQFSKLSKEIMIAAKQGGGNPDSNFRLKAAIQNARSASMPKDKIENAIKKGEGSGQANFDEIVYEGYAPHGVAILVETATDNSNRTVANIRNYFTKHGGSLGKTGSLEFVFEKRSIFKIKDADFDSDDLELDLIDFDLKDIYKENEEEVIIETGFTAFGETHRYLDEKNITVIESKTAYTPLSKMSVDEAQAEAILKILERMEEDDDVQNVYHNME